MTNKNIAACYNGIEIRFDEQAWFNATKAAERFGKRVDHYLANADTKDYIAVLLENTSVDGLLNPRKVGDLVKSRRGRNGGTWMHPDLAVHFARWLDVRFSIWCDRQIRSILSGSHPHYDWKRMRHEATSSFKVMNAVLQLVRQNQDKPTARHHFSNEARLVNWALTGTFQALDREGLTYDELDLLACLEERNTVLLGLGIDYGTRKIALQRFASEWIRPTRLVTSQGVDP